jgi:hypothetical protein
MCKKSRDFIDHLLLHYEVARDLWSLLFKLCSVVWVMHRRVRELVSCEGSKGLHNILEVWSLAFLCLMWCIWREWNVRSFEHREISVVKAKRLGLNAS